MRWFPVFRKPATAGVAEAAATPARTASAVQTHAGVGAGPAGVGSGVDIHFLDMALDRGMVSAAPIEQLLERAEPLIQRLYHEIGWGRDDFDAMIRPLIQRYASYVHLLPASESHHHARLGGLLLHGLEVAIEATRASREAVVDLDRVFLRDTELRASRSRLWPVAAACAGFLHDLGKALVDLIVADADTDEVWNPYESSFAEWANEHAVRRYTVSWRSGQRLKRHEPFGLVLTWPVIGKDLIALLNAYGRDMFEEMLMGALEDSQSNNGLGRIVNDADTASVRRDRDAQRKRWREGVVGGHPVVNRVLEAFHGLLADGTWQPNTVGGCVWVTPQGIFLSWANAVSQARGWLRENAASGSIPNDGNAIADLLIDAQIAKPRLMANGTLSRVWMVKPLSPAGFSGLGVVQMLLIADVSLLFKGRVMPDPIVLEIMADPTGVQVVPMETEDPAEATTVVVEEATIPAEVPASQAPAPLEQRAMTPTDAPTSLPRATEPAEAPAPMPASAASSVSPESSAPPSDGIPSMEEAIAFFENCGAVGRWLVQLMTDCAKDPDRFANLVCYREKKLLVRWPDAAASSLESPTDIVKFLNERPELLANSFKGAVIDPARGSLVIKALVNVSEPLWPAVVFSDVVSRYAFLIGDPRPVVDRKIRRAFAAWANEQAQHKDLGVVPAGLLVRTYARTENVKPRTVSTALLREPALILGASGHEADQRLDMGAISSLLQSDAGVP